MSGDVFIGAVPDLKRQAGFLKYMTCTLIIKRETLIIAHSTRELRNTFKKISPSDHYRLMTIRQVLAETPENFALKPEEIVRIRLQKGDKAGTEVPGGPDRLFIRTHEKRHKFLFGPQSISAAEARGFFEPSFSDFLT